MRVSVRRGSLAGEFKACRQSDCAESKAGATVDRDTRIELTLATAPPPSPPPTTEQPTEPPTSPTRNADNADNVRTDNARTVNGGDVSWGVKRPGWWGCPIDGVTGGFMISLLSSASGRRR